MRWSPPAVYQLVRVPPARLTLPNEPAPWYNKKRKNLLLVLKFVGRWCAGRAAVERYVVRLVIQDALDTPVGEVVARDRCARIRIPMLTGYGNKAGDRNR